MVRVDVAEDSVADLAAGEATMTIKMVEVGAVVLTEEEAEGSVVDPAVEGLEEAMIIKTREETEKNVEGDEEIKRNQVMGGIIILLVDDLIIVPASAGF